MKNFQVILSVCFFVLPMAALSQTFLQISNYDFEVSPAQLFPSSGELSTTILSFGNTGQNFSNNGDFQGISSEIGAEANQRAYLSGPQSGSYPAFNNRFYGLVFFGGASANTPGFVATDVKGEGYERLSTSLDFSIERGTSTANQSLLFYIFDPMDAADPETFIISMRILVNNSNEVFVFDLGNDNKATGDELTIAIENSDGRIDITFPTLPNNHYQILAGNDVSNLTLLGPLISGTGEVLSRSFSTDADAEFYKVATVTTVECSYYKS